MRPYLIAAALLLAVGGCSANDRTEAAPASAPSAAGRPAAAGETGTAGATPGAAATTAAGKTTTDGDAALSSDTEAICKQAAKVSTDFGATFAADRLLIKTSAKNPQARTEAEQKAARYVRNFSHALLDMAKLVDDPKVKKALGAMGAEVTALKGDVAKIDDKKLAGLQATLDKACGRG